MLGECFEMVSGIYETGKQADEHTDTPFYRDAKTHLKSNMKVSANVSVVIPIGVYNSFRDMV